MLPTPVHLCPGHAHTQQVEAALPDKGEQLAVGCKSGKRSEMAAAMMSQEGGYTTLKNVAGGFDSWLASGLPVAK